MGANAEGPDRLDDHLIILRDEMFAELVSIGSEPSNPDGTLDITNHDRFMLLSDALRSCIDLRKLAILVGLDFYSREPQPTNTEQLYWVDLQEEAPGLLIYFTTAEAAAAFLVESYDLNADVKAEAVQDIMRTLESYG